MIAVRGIEARVPAAQLRQPEQRERQRLGGGTPSLRDSSVGRKTVRRGGGAAVVGGDSTAGTVFRQTVAQEGRQNNSCDNAFPATLNNSSDSRCGAANESVEICHGEK
ncbi:hypothetical protein [Streptomyces meridianus]|uniref:Uncharacterized protein n=1 Tax=Streptomyces meridianus TaxID=2938945 RepID=A0ABT0X926_9ACTN|nr:hypothetical protein [Streptomyces meridianus]MCM2579039.1 hypothetical protein [Streptomyces meridianus]